MGNDKNKPSKSIFRSLAKQTPEKPQATEEPVELKPALPDLGTAPCPVCQQRVTVFVTRTKRPFINCGYCSARIFYNGRESMRRLKEVLKPIKES
jgi:DNA-directed RNA polymerase subunit RPC12/RpoP